MAVTRRGVLVGGLIGGALVVGYGLRPRRYGPPLSPAPDEVAFDAWLKLGTNGVVTVAVPQVEMGQGVTTLLPQIAAVELGADWRKVAVERAPGSAVYANVPLASRWADLAMPAMPSWFTGEEGVMVRRWAQDHAFTVTADGTELAAYEAPVRAAAASARALLCMAAAKRWDVAWEECDTQAGFVIHDGKRLSFGSLAQQAAEYDPPATLPLREKPAREVAAAFPAGGALRFPRLDLPSKVEGSHTFAGDVRLPDMVYAAIRHGPIGRASFAGYDKSAASDVRGLITLVHNPEWVAAVATNWWAAETALTRIDAQFSATNAADTDQIDAAMDSAMRSGEASRIYSAGDPDSYLTGTLPLQLRYEVAPALHATIETASVTARFAGGQLELWLGTQAPQAAREDAARALHIDPQRVVIYPVSLGGSFDARLESDHAVEAALIAKACQRPVQLMWSRKQEHFATKPRPPVVAVLGANVDAEGRLGGLRARIAAPATTLEFGRRLFDGATAQDALDAGGQVDPMMLEGAVPPYAIAHVAIDHVPVKIPLPTGRMRANAHGYTAFFTESFVDELAHRAGREPLAYRMAMLGSEPRLAACLQRVAQLANWGGGGDNSGQGIACHILREGRIAVVASARRDAQGVRVDKLSAVVDIGRIVNVDIARQQIEGGLVFGLGLVLGSITRYERGLPVTGRLSSLSLPVLADCPTIEVDFVESDADPADPSELGVAVVGPAVANALFSATGLRLRQLPLLSEDI